MRDAVDTKGRTPLHHAHLEGQMPCQGILLESGCSESATDSEGQTPKQLGAASMGKGNEGGGNSFLNM